MRRIAHFILIDAPIRQVFDFVADYRNLPKIQAHFKRVHLLSPEAEGPGARIEAYGTFHGLPLSAEMSIVDYEPPHLIVSDSTGGVQSHSVWRFREEPPAAPGAAPRVRAVLAIDYEVHLPGLGLLGGLVHHELDGLTIDALRRLKRLMEQPAGAAAKREPEGGHE